MRNVPLWRACILFFVGLLTGVLTLTAASPIKTRPLETAVTPTLGNYPNVSLAQNSETTVTPDVAPTNAASMNVSTSTNFKGLLDANPATGIVRVTNAHPVGSYLITVKAFDSHNGGALAASATFLLNVTAPVETCNPVSFGSAANISGDNAPFAVAVGDFNDDGEQDLALANPTSNNVSILLGDGHGNFSAAVNFGVGNHPGNIAVGDFNGDGEQDLAVVNSNNISILLGDGAGNFSAAVNFVAGNGSGSTAVGDFNGDGKQDLVTRINANKISVLMGDGAGNFGAPTNFGVGNNPTSLALADFNGDGKQDVAVANFDSSGVSILLGNGAGSFSDARTWSVGGNPSSVVVGDFNGDGKQDLAAPSAAIDRVFILLGDGMGHFGAATSFAVGGTIPVSTVVGDFNGDGRQDLALGNVDSHNVSILFGDGAGSFGGTITLPTANRPFSLVVGDFNDDSKQDLAACIPDLSFVSVFMRSCVATPTSVVSRKTHSEAGNFDINLPRVGNPGVECRSGGANGDYQLVFSFANPITSVDNASVASGIGNIASRMIDTDAHNYIVNLTGVTNAQIINVTLTNVNDNAGNSSSSVSVSMSVLIGDVNGNGAVNASDIAQAKINSGALIDATNFRSDTNANGSFNASDVTLVKSKSGTSVGSASRASTR